MAALVTVTGAVLLALNTSQLLEGEVGVRRVLALAAAAFILGLGLWLLVDPAEADA